MATRVQQLEALRPRGAAPSCLDEEEDDGEDADADATEEPAPPPAPEPAPPSPPVSEDGGESESVPTRPGFLALDEGLLAARAASLHSHYPPVPTPTPALAPTEVPAARSGSVASRRRSRATVSAPPSPPTTRPPPPEGEEEERASWRESRTPRPPPTEGEEEERASWRESPARPPSTVTRATATERRPRAEEDIERQALLRQLDLLRMRFKQSVIPGDIERQRTPVVKMVVERNLVQLRRARNVAMYKLALAGVLVVIEFVLARVSGLDMGRFMRWNLSNEAEAPPAWIFFSGG